MLEIKDAWNDNLDRVSCVGGESSLRKYYAVGSIF